MSIDAEKVKKQVAAILKKHGVKRASFFGSFARGEAAKDSDLDILIEFEGEKSLLDLVGVKLEIEDMLNMSADVLTYDALFPAMRDSVLREEMPII